MKIGKLNFLGKLKFTSQADIPSQQIQKKAKDAALIKYGYPDLPKPKPQNDAAMIKYGYPDSPKPRPQQENEPPCLKYAIPSTNDDKKPIVSPIFPKYGYPEINRPNQEQ